MSYDPTEWAPQTPGQQPAQPPVTPPAYGQAPQPPASPAQGQVAPTQYSAQPPAYGQPQPSAPAYGQPSNPAWPPYGQPQQPGQSNPAFPPYGGQPSNPALPPYGQPQQPGQSNPALPPYGQPQQTAPAFGQSNPGLPQYGAPADPYAPQQSNPAFPPYGQAPQPGQSNPGLPPYGGAPAEQYGQAPQPGQSNPGFPPYGQAPQQPWGAAMPPGYIPPPAPAKKSGMKLWIIILVIVVVLGGIGGGGFAFYQATRPKPVISVASKYQDGAISVGAASTSFTLSGSDFTGSSAITFLLDGSAVPGAPSAQSDSNGKLAATTLAVTSAWSVGTHTLTAKDASGYLTKTGVKVEIVTPGKTNTPGPNGAPTDSATMSIAVTIQGGTSTLGVKNSSVCGDKDTGQPQTSNGTATNGVTFVATLTLTCTGTYQGGKLTYTETATGLKFVYSEGLVCSADKSFVYRHLDGTFTSATAVSGSYSTDAIVVNCNLGVGNVTALAPDQGTWTGIAAVS